MRKLLRSMRAGEGRGMDKHSPQRVERDNAKFEEWQKQNPTKQFKDYFAETVKPMIARGKVHASLGGNLIEGNHGEIGQGFLRTLIANGLKPEDVCVDYGCGTLRLGVHVMKYLRPGAYWGMDIAEFLLEEGRALVDEELLSEQRPNLRVISPQAVAEAASRKPAMLFSAKVLLHVHPDELGEYLQNIMTMIGAHGQAIILSKWNDGATLQYGGKGWAHGLPVMQDMVAAWGGQIVVLKEDAYRLEGFDTSVKHGTLHLTHHASPFAGERD
jgi:hypothetical protein